MIEVRGTAIKIRTGMLRAIGTTIPVIGPQNIKTVITFTDIPNTTGGHIIEATIIPDMSGVLFITATTTGIGR